MATYKEIFGTNIEVLASDPANPVQGQVWYNSTDNVVKGAAATTAGAWATGGTMNTARNFSGDMSVGTQTSTLATGSLAPVAGNPGLTELYNGSAWTEVADLNSARYGLGGVGANNTEGLAFGGEAFPNPSPFFRNFSESWNGSVWTEVGDLNTARFSLGSAGTITSALAFGGEIPGSITGDTESYNGTSWSELNNLNTARRLLSGTGVDSTSALAIGGNNLTAAIGNVESWNGTSWTETTDLNTTRQGSGSAGASSTSALAVAGGQPPTLYTNTEEWDGVSWTETTDIPTGTAYQGGTGTTASAIVFGGGTPTLTNATYEWTGAGSPLIQTFTDS